MKKKHKDLICVTGTKYNGPVLKVDGWRTMEW